MKNKITRPAADRREPSESAIRDYAYQLYQQSGGEPNRDLDHWWEAIACLKAGIPAAESHRRHQLLPREKHGEPIDSPSE